MKVAKPMGAIRGKQPKLNQRILIRQIAAVREMLNLAALQRRWLEQ